MNADYTKVALEELHDFAADRVPDGSVQARGVRGPIEAEQTGAMFHRLKPNVRQPFGHVHNKAEELFLVLNGSGTAMVNDEAVPLKKMDAIRVSPSAARCFEAGPDGIEILAFGPHVESDGRLLPGWWGGEIPPAE
jgi:mannose-6-phosphate isomerase-like protein (cupin superfamily)